MTYSKRNGFKNSKQTFFWVNNTIAVKPFIFIRFGVCKHSRAKDRYKHTLTHKITIKDTASYQIEWKGFKGRSSSTSAAFMGSRVSHPKRYTNGCKNIRPAPRPRKGRCPFGRVCGSKQRENIYFYATRGAMHSVSKSVRVSVAAVETNAKMTIGKWHLVLYV